MEAKAVESKTSFISPVDLLKNSWNVFKVSWKKLLLLAVLPYLALIPFALIVGIFVALGIFLYNSQNLIPLILLSFIGVVLAILYLTIVFSVSSLAMIFQIAEKPKSHSVKELLRKGWSIVWSYWVLSLLSSLLIFGGILLFIVPGIIFSIWFAFAMYVLVVEGTKGMDALVKSREYVRGHWWGVFGRLLLISILVYALIWVSTMIFSTAENEGIAGILQFVISILVTPFTVIYSFLMYDSLKKAKPGVATSKPSDGSKRIYTVVAVLGGILLFGLIFWITQLALQSFNQYQQNPNMFDPGQLEEVVPTNTSQLLPPLEES